MKLLPEDIRQLFNSNRFSFIEKIIVVSIYLCAFSIMLSITIAQSFAIIIIILAIVCLIKNPKREKSPFDIPLFIFILVRILSIFLSVDIKTSITGLYTEIPYYVIFYALLQQRNILNMKQIQSLLVVLIIVGIIGTCYGAVIVLLGLKERAESLTSGYYNFGTYLIAILTITLMLGKTSIFDRKRWVWYGLIFIMAIGILLTLNRIHLVIMILAFIIVGAILERKLLVMIVIVISIGILFSPSINRRLNQTIHFTENLSERDILWSGALQISSNHPFLGYGPNTFSKIFPFPDKLQDAKIGGWHNDYIQVYIESGALGLIAMLWLILSIYKQILSHKSEGEKHKTILALATGITTIFFSSLTGSAFLNILIRILFGFLLAFLALLVKEENDQ